MLYSGQPLECLFRFLDVSVCVIGKRSWSQRKKLIDFILLSDHCGSSKIRTKKLFSSVNTLSKRFSEFFFCERVRDRASETLWFQDLRLQSLGSRTRPCTQISGRIMMLVTDVKPSGSVWRWKKIIEFGTRWNFMSPT